MRIFAAISFCLCLLLSTPLFTASATPPQKRPDEQKLPPGRCLAICDNTKYCNCAAVNYGDAICTNDNCIVATATTGKAICHGPSCIAAMVTVGTADCKGKSCRLAGKTSGDSLCSGGKCDCVGEYASFKGHCADERKKIQDWLLKYR